MSPGSFSQLFDFPARPIAVLLVMAGFASAGPSLAASDCDSIASVPITWNIDYANDIQNVFNTRCSNCHVDNPSPAMGMDLSDGVSYDNIVNVESAELPGRFRVIPGNPLNSVLFQKINCNQPDAGSRMPLGRAPLPLSEQALIYDWIMLGAPSMQTDFIFFNGFEPRP